MGSRTLLLLVLFASSCILAQEDGTESQNPSCSKDAMKFRHLRKYTYNYDAATTSGVTGTADSQSGSKFNCKVELEVPQLCNYILRIKQCTLREVYGVSSEGKALYKKAKNSEDFSNAMSKYEVSFSVQEGKRVILYPKEEEPVNILNIKRGIISALLVPDETQEASNIDTVYGKCKSEISVGKKGGADVMVSTNLKTCDQFTPFRDHVSPIALFKGLNTPLSTLLSSSQSCQYSLDTKRKHVTEASCTETHLFLPFSHKNQYGMMAKVTQTLKLEDSSKTNNREFADSQFIKGLALEAAESPSSSEDAVLENLMELQKASSSEQNQQRANTFHKLVTALRSLNNETLGPLVPRLMQLSSPITLQALTQCGTVECFGAILQVMRTGDVPQVLTDTFTYALGFLPSPCTKRVRELLNMAQYTQSRASFYALSHAVNNFYEDTQTITPELTDVANFMSSLLDNECTGDQDKTFLTLKAIGISGNVLEAANPQIKSSILKCVRSQAPSFDVQKAAIQALRKMSIADDVRGPLVQVFQNGNSPVQKRLAAYLILMKNPSQSDLRRIIRTLNKDDNEQVKNFVASHIVNIQNSQAPEMQELKGKVEETLKSSGVPAVVSDFTKLSKNYQISKTVPGLSENLGAKVEGNIIYDFTGYMPREVMLETTLNVFGESVDLFEIGAEGKGFEPTLDALFGKEGFFPDTATKALYWADGKVPDQVTKVLYKWFGVSRDNNQDQDLKKAILFNAEKMIQQIISSGAPEAKAYLEILGKELGYVTLKDFKTLGSVMLKSFQSAQNLPGKIAEMFSRGFDSDLFIHYIFMDNQFSLPTGSGLQLQVSLSGIIAPGAKAGIKAETKGSMSSVNAAKAEFSLKPAVAVQFVTQLGIQIPEFSKHAVQMNTNIYHESGIQASASLSLKDAALKFSIPAPTTPTKLLSINNKVNLVFASKTEVMPSIVENREERTTCRPLFTGLNYCTNIGYSNASSIDSAPYFPLTGETRYELEIQPTGEVKEYSLTADMKTTKEDKDKVHTLRISIQAEENKPPEASLTLKCNRNKNIWTSNLEIPKADINVGGSIRYNDESNDFQRSFAIIAELNNQQVPEVTFTGRLRYDGSTEGVLSGELLIPRLQTEARADATLRKVQNDFSLQLRSSASICALSGSQNLVFTYDNEKVELDWSTASNSNVKKMVSKLPDIRFSDLASYPESLKTYANKVLDHKVAQTDMTIRHIASQSIVATNNWLQAAARSSPYAETLSRKLRSLRDLDWQEMGIPAFPENLFLNSDGKIRYKFNKESITINIPLPYAGKTSHQILPKTLRSPSLELQSMGINIPAKEFKVLAFTIPEYYQLRVPLLGVLDLSSSINSNYYNWSASYTGGNTTSDIQSYALSYQMKADSIVDILSYNIDGSAKGSYDPRDILTLSYEGSLRHTLLDAGIRLSEIYNFQSNEILKATYSYQARSVLGLEASVDSSVRSRFNERRLFTVSNINSRLNVASLYANGDWKLVYAIDPESLESQLESDYKFDSSYLKATNKLAGEYQPGAVTLSSTTDLQDGALVNTMTVNYKNQQLTLKSDTNGNYYNLVGLNRFELALSKQMAAIRSEYQADYKRNRFYTLLSGSLNSLGLELNADVTLNNQASRGAHKATLKLNQDGLSTSATTNVNFSPLLLENEWNAGIGSAGAVMKMMASVRYREYGAKISADGKGSLSELSLGSVYHATLPGVDSKHLVNFRVSKEGLKFNNNLMGSYGQVKLGISNDLSIAGYVLQLTSKLENSLSTDRFHKHRFDFQMQPYTVTALLNNEMQYGALEFTNKGEVQLEAFKVNFNGNMRGAYNKDEIKHSYGFSAGNMAANINTDTIANIQGTAHTHRFTLDIAGLSVSLSSNTNCECKVMRFTNRIRSVVQPFTITIDSQTNGDGSLMIFGQQTGQLYSKFIMKAEPLSFNLVHDYRGSTTHQFGAGNNHETLLDYNVNLLFTPSEQLSSWKLKSRLDQTTYNQDFSAFNNADSIGVQLSGQTLADLSILDRKVTLPFVRFNPIDSLNLRDKVNVPQEFSISGHIKYDKNKDMHIIHLPFIENMSLYFEKIRTALLTTLQALQASLKDVDIDQYVQRYRRALDTAGERMSDYVNSLDLESKANLARERIVSLANGFKITAEEMQSAVEDYFTRLQASVDRYIKENYDLDKLRKSIEVFIQKCMENLKAFDDKYKIREKTIEMIQDIRVFVDKISINDVEESMAAWIQNLEEQYRIKANIQRVLHQIQVYIQRIDIAKMSQSVKEFLQSSEVSKFFQQIKNSMPLENIRIFIAQIKNLVATQLEEFQISEKINAVVDKFQDFVATYEIDRKLEVLIEKFIEFLNQQKVKETIKKATDMLNNIDIRAHSKRIRAFVDTAVKQVRDYDFKKLIDDINYYLDILVQKMRSFNYDKFVDDFNNKIKELTETVNDKLRALELPQKAEALRRYLNDVRAVVTQYLQEVRETRLAAIAQWYKDIMTSTVLVEWKTRAIEYLEDVRDRIYAMNIKEEFQRYLQQVSMAYRRFVISLMGYWDSVTTKINNFAKENDIQEWADRMKVLVEEGFVVPEIYTAFIRIPAFEVSLRALREGIFRTPHLIVPFTDLQIRPVEINFRNLRGIEIPTRIVTPQFTLFNSYIVPSYTIDLNEIKLKIARIIDQIISSDYTLPSPDILLRDITMSDMGLPHFSIPEIYIPNMQLPDYKMPKLNLENFQFSDIKIPEFQLPKIPHSVSVPTFGTLSGSFKVVSPFFKMSTLAEVKNSTVSEKTPEMVASLTTEATSMMEALDFTFAADARISAPLMEQLVFKETVSLANRHVKVDHFSEVAFASSQIQTQIQTKASLKTEKNTADLQNSIFVKVQKRITADVSTKYSHRLNIPQLDISSQLDLQNDVDTTVDIGRISLISSGKGNWRWACPLFTDEGTHQADVKFNLKGGKVELLGTNKINDKYLKLEQSLKYDSVFLNYVSVDVTSKADAPNVGNSIATLKGNAQVSDMKVELEATHNAELIGRATGTINNNFSFLTKAFEIKLSTANNGNLKVSFPLSLTGRIEFLNNYDFILNPTVQQVSWQANGRFNQYKVAHTVLLGNNEDRIEASLATNGEANLDFLAKPISIPQLQVPYTSMKTPEVRDFSVWEKTGLKNLLTSTRQNFDLNIKLQYQKNKDVHLIPLPINAVVDTINEKITLLNEKFKPGRDRAVTLLENSYNQAKAKFDKYNVNNQVSGVPRTFSIPGYTIPLVNIEVSSFSAEIPAFGYVVPKEITTPSFVVPMIGFSIPSYKLVIPSMEMPVLHVPKRLREITLPKLKSSERNGITIPALGNLTYEFFFKSNVISLTTSAGIYNQSDVSARVSVASTSVIDALQFNIDATTGLTRKRGLKLATALALKSVFAEGKHESSISFGKRNIEASVITNAKLDTLLLKSTLTQELTGNTKTKSAVSSTIALTYDFIDPLLGNSAKGKLGHTLGLEGLTSYFSVQSKISGDITGTLLTHQTFDGTLNGQVNTYMNSNGLRSAISLAASSRAVGLGNMALSENLAVEASPSRIYAVLEHRGENYLRITPLFTSTGQQSGKVTLELALWSLLADLQMKISQPNSFIEAASFDQAITLNVNTDKQEFSMNGQGILESLVLAHNIKLSNDQTDARVEAGGSLQGHVAFLKSIILPVYDRSLWDVLKLDVTTHIDRKQFLNASTTLIYTKSNNGFFYPIASERIGDGSTVTFPGMSRPEIQFPAADIKLLYTTAEGSNIPLVEMSSPQYQITLSQYTLPKKIYDLDLNSLFNKIADIDLPTIEIPEQKIVIPPVKLRLPAGIYIPAFGSISGSVQFASPVYNLTWTNKLENKPDSLVGSIDATSSSTLRFLEFDLDASLAGSLNGGTLTLVGQGSLAHVDLSTTWKEEASFNDLRLSQHSLQMDITSPTFSNAQIRCQNDGNGISSVSVSSPSTGTLGLLLEKDSKSIKLKVYSRSAASPDKEVLLLKNELSLKNSDKIQNKLNWREEAVQDVLNGLKEKLPKMSDAIYNCVNKYHKEHLGMDINEAGLQMKERLQTKVSSAYSSAYNHIDNLDYQLRSAARGASSKYADIVSADMSVLLNDGVFDSRLYEKSVIAIRRYQSTMKEVIDAAITFLKSTRFQLPGQSRKYSGEEQFAMGMKWTVQTMEQCIQKIQELLENFIQSINDVTFTVPGTNIKIETRQVILVVKDFLRELQQISKKVFNDLQYLSLEKNLQQLKALVQEVSQKSEKVIEALKTKNYEDIKRQTQQMYNDAMNSQYVQYLSKLAGDIKKSSSQLLKVYQNIYEELSEKLKQLLVYAKALREEYLDPNIVGWSVKYYEIEEKVLQLFKLFIDTLKELPSKYGINVSEITDQMKRLLKEYYEQSRVLLTNAENKGRKQVQELSMKLEEKVGDWSRNAKQVAAEQSQIVNAKLHEAYGQLQRSYEKFLVEANRLIDLVIQKYNAFIEFLNQMLQNFQNSASEEVKTYVSTRKGELKVEIPHPFDWKSFDEIPQVRRDIMAKRMEIARSMVLEGIEKGSKQWEELQRMIGKQVEDGKLTAQQIIENIKNWRKNN